MLDEIQAVPGVERAGLIDDFFIDNDRERGLTVEGDQGTVSARLPMASADASADFFRAIGTPLVRGRVFSMDDGPEAPPVAIVNEAMARRFWPGSDPVGRRLKFDPPSPWYTVVGVVADMHRQGPERDPVPQVFRAIAQSPTRSVNIFIRTSSDDLQAMVGSLRAAVRRVERDAPIFAVTPFEQQLLPMRAASLPSLALTAFSIVALVMAAVGIYGLIQYSVTTRTQEIGLRMAMGARGGDIFRMVIGEGLTLSAIGLGLGLAGAWWLARAGVSLLVGVNHRSVDVGECLAPADGGCRRGLLFPSPTRHDHRSHGGLAQHLDKNGALDVLTSTNRGTRTSLRDVLERHQSSLQRLHGGLRAVFELSFESRRLTCVFTVSSPMPRSAAMSAFDRPGASRRRTSASRGVRSSR